MEKCYQFSINGIEPSQVRSLMPVAVQASEGKVVQFRGAAMLPWRDVIDMKS